MNWKTIGEISEAYIVAELLSNGYVVSKTVGDNQRYDIVVEDVSGRLMRVQCKTGRYKDGFVAFHLCSNSGGLGRKDYHGQIDAFATFCVENKRVYLIPIEKCGTSIMHLRTSYPKSGAVSNVNWASDYIIGDIPENHFQVGVSKAPSISNLLTPKAKAAHVAARKIEVSDEELKALVWAKPLRSVASDLGVSDVAVKKACKRRGIATPQQGYWNRATIPK
jgi:hypothetical protein